MKIPWYALFLAGFIAGLLVSLPGCEKDPVVVKEIDSVETEKVTVHLMQLDPVAIDVPEPVKVEEYIPAQGNSLEYDLANSTGMEYNLDQLRTYIDTAIFDGLQLAYTIQTRGELYSAVFTPTFRKEIVTKTITITKTEKEKAKPMRGLYVGLNIGGNKTTFGTLAPQLDYFTPKNIFRANYNLIDQTINIGVSRRLF